MALCTPGETGMDRLLNFEFIEAVTCSYSEPAGGVLVVGTIVLGAVALSVYIRTSSPIIPLGLLLLGGGAMMSVVAGVGAAIATTAFLTLGAGAVAYFYHRWARP